MSINDDRIPLSPLLKEFDKKIPAKRKTQSKRRILLLSLQATINAIIIGFVAKFLVLLIYLVTNLAFYGRLSLNSSSPSANQLGFFVILIPVVGSLLIGFMAKYGSSAIRGHGIPEAMEKIIREESRIPPAITFLKPLSAAISIGTGGPFGAEGPIIATGGAFGSLTGQIMHISAVERKIILTAGACAGMAAIFGTPLAALLLAIELLLFEFSPKSIIPVTVACLTGAAMHIILFDKSPVFAMQPIPVATNTALLTYILFGGIIGLFASLVSKSVYAIEDLFEKIRIHWMWWPALGGLVVGIIGFFSPITLGVGYDNIQNLLNAKQSLNILLSLCLLKYLSWAIALGSGTSGGTLAPLLTIGGSLGALLAMIFAYIFPGTQIDPATTALIGMAAMFAGASRAILTSIVFALETTSQTNGLLPLIGACIAAYLVSFILMKGSSIMTEKIKRRGISTPDTFEPDPLQAGSVMDLITPIHLPMKTTPCIFSSDDVGLAAEIMGKYNAPELLVLDNKQSMKEIGVITSASILKYYSALKQKEISYDSPGKTKRLMVQGRKFIRKIDDSW
jgi:H+/Cl- antiporter ClcA